MFHNDIAPRAQYPLVTYGITPLGESGAGPVSADSLSRDRRGLATTASAISIATLVLTVSGFHVGYSGFTSAEQRSAVHYEVETGEMMAGSPVVETFAVNTSTDHQSLSHPANVPPPSEQTSGQLTTIRHAVIFDNFDELNAENADITEFFEKVQKAKSESQTILPQIALDTANVSVMRYIDHTSLSTKRHTGLGVADTDRSAFSGSKLDDTALIEGQAILVGKNITSNLTENTSRLLPSLSEPELSTINPVVAALGDMDAELGETEWETKVYGPAAGHQDTRSLPAPQELAVSVGALKTPAASTPRKARERAGNAQREIGGAIANLKIRLGDQPTSGLSPSETHTRTGKAAEPVSRQVQYAMSSTGKSISSLAVTVLDGDLVSVRLDEIISLFEREMDKPLFVWLKSSSNADKFVTPELLRHSGIAVDYNDATKQLILSIAK
jgi:hypothetical protein